MERKCNKITNKYKSKLKFYHERLFISVNSAKFFHPSDKTWNSFMISTSDQFEDKGKYVEAYFIWLNISFYIDNINISKSINELIPTKY